MLKTISSFLVFMALVSCTNVETTETPAVITPTVIPTNTSIPFPLILSATSTREVTCDPFADDFCIMEGYFTLERPIHPPANHLVDLSYPYGSTQNGTRDPHHGVEFANPSGTPVYAAAEGTVIFAGPDSETIFSPWQNYYGNLIVIEHKEKLFTLYAHLSKIDVEMGQHVFAEDKIGEVGSTGVAIGSHLHFEVRREYAQDYFATQNPELWMIPSNDEHGRPFGLLQISVVDQDHQLIQHARLTIQYHPEKSGPLAKSYYGTTYSPDMLNGDTRSSPVDENAAFSGLPAGYYRIAVESNGKVYERWVEVEWGKLTQVVLVVN